MLVVVHDRAKAWALADRIIVLLDGRIEAHGPPAVVLERPPSRAVAGFVGFVGLVNEPDGNIRMLRTAHVVLDPQAETVGRVVRRVPTEDGVRIVLGLPHGRVVTLAPLPGPALGDRVTGG